MVQFGTVPNSVYDAVAKDTAMSLDTMSEEDRDFFASRHGIKFLNATSNQAICFGNWMMHPQNVLEATKIVNKKLGSAVPTSSADPAFSAYIDKIIFYSTAITGRNQLSGITGRVLSQVDPIYSKDAEATYHQAKNIIEAYEDIGVDRSKVVIKIATTWEAMQAAKKLYNEEHISCLGTVVHSLEQAVLAAEADCVTISPYVDELEVNLDPSSYVKTSLDTNYGYKLTVDVHKYYKAYGIKTVICIAAMIGQNTILGLSGIDEMTVPVVTLHKILNNSVPEGFEVPALKSTYTTAEAGPKLSFINDKDAYYKSLSANEVAQKRIDFATETFISFGLKSKSLVKNVLLEYDYITE